MTEREDTDSKVNTTAYRRVRTKTEAYHADKSFMDIMHDEASFCYKPWQFSEYQVCADTLKTTYEEITIWALQEAMLRPGWKIEDKVVHIPNLFSKVNGISGDLTFYRDEVAALADAPKTLFYKKFPMFREKRLKNIGKIYAELLNEKGYIDKDRLMASPYWRYKRLKPSLQEELARRIAGLCYLPDFWRYKNYKTKLKISFVDKLKQYLLFAGNRAAKEEYLMKLSTLQVLLSLPEEMIELLENFDYPMKIPKIIVYNIGKYNTCSFTDVLTLMFMNSMGVDIVIFNPAGTSDIENFVKENYYDIHHLGKTQKDLHFKRNGFFSNLFD